MVVGNGQHAVDHGIHQRFGHLGYLTIELGGPSHIIAHVLVQPGQTRFGQTVQGDAHGTGVAHQAGDEINRGLLFGDHPVVVKHL